MSNNNGMRYPEGFTCGKSMVFYQIKDIEPNTFPTETEKLVESIRITSNPNDDESIILKQNLILSKQYSYGNTDWTEEEVRSARTNPSHGPGSITIISQPTGTGLHNAGHYEARCLSKNTLITMSDGRQEKLKYIKKGDKILCADGKIDIVIFNDYDKMKFGESYIKYTFSDKTSLIVIKDHRVYSIEDKCYKKLSQFKIGEHTYTQNGKIISLEKSKEYKSRLQHCTIWTKNYNSYYANGILCGNRFGNIKNGFIRRLVMFCWNILIKLKIVI